MDYVSKCNYLEVNGAQYDDKNIHTRIGYLITCDLILIINICKSNTSSERTFTTMYNTDVIISEFLNVSDINLVIAPHTTIVFWEKHEDVTILTSISDLQKTKNRVFVVSSSILSKLQNELDTIIFKRIFLHNTKDQFNLQYSFKWYVYSNEILYRKNTFDLPENIQEKICINAIQSDHTSELSVNAVLCKKPIESLTLDGLVNDVIIDAINQYDIQKALQHIVSFNIKREDDVIKTVLRTFNDKLDSLQISREMVKKMFFASETERGTRIQNIDTKTHEINSKKHQLLSRIQNSNVCFICYSEIVNKTIMKCCMNKVCFTCINKWLCLNNICPLCKKENPVYYIVSTQVKCNSLNSENLSEENYIFENFSILISNLKKKNPNCKILIIGSSNKFNSLFEPCLSQPFLVFKGNITMLKKKLLAFQCNKVDILMMDEATFNKGIYIDLITDIVLITALSIELNMVIAQCPRLQDIWKLCYK